MTLTNESLNTGSVANEPFTQEGLLVGDATFPVAEASGLVGLLYGIANESLNTGSIANESLNTVGGRWDIGNWDSGAQWDANYFTNESLNTGSLINESLT